MSSRTFSCLPFRFSNPVNLIQHASSLSLSLSLSYSLCSPALDTRCHNLRSKFPSNWTITWIHSAIPRAQRLFPLTEWSMPDALFHVRPSSPLFYRLTFTREIALSNCPFVPSLCRYSLPLSLLFPFFLFFQLFARLVGAAAAFSELRVRLAFRDRTRDRIG